MKKDRFYENLPHWKWKFERIFAHIGGKTIEKAGDGFGKYKAWNKDKFHDKQSDFTPLFNDFIQM